MCGKCSTRKDVEKGTERVGNPEGKLLLVRPKHMLHDNIKINLRERVRSCGMDSFVSGPKPMVCSSEHSTGNQTSIR